MEAEVLVTVGKEGKGLQVTGKLRSDKPKRSAFALKATRGLRIKRQAGGILLLGP